MFVEAAGENIPVKELVVSFNGSPVTYS